ncbi:MAG: nucleoid occlusion protein [Veillonellales bacterium]
MKNIARLLGFGEEKVEKLHLPETEAVAAGIGETAADAAVEEAMADSEIQYIVIDSIVPNPFQPRKTFNEESLQELSLSIQQYGVIQPLLVRQTTAGFELVAGERRLRASKLAGLNEVPVIVKELTDKEMAELAMIENLQREDLHYLEEAEGFQKLIANFGFTQEELAHRVGKNQSTIANKLRLLKLAPQVRDILAAENLTERHARSLLKLEDTKLQLEVLHTVREKGLNVRETEGLIEDIVTNISREIEKENTPRQNVVKVIKDVRIFLNSINKVVAEMKKAGLRIKVRQEQDDQFITLTMKIPKRK